MERHLVIQELMNQQIVSSTLKRNSNSKNEVKSLQNLLHELGFGHELRWDTFGADGDYGGSTAKAVKAFAERNGLEGDGDIVTTVIATMLLVRYDILDDLRHVHDAIQRGKVEEFYFRNSPHAIAVTALQTLLHTLGFDEELKWARFGADGQYGAGTTKALIAFARTEHIRTEGKVLSEELAKKIVQKVQRHFGSEWAADISLATVQTGRIQIREVVENNKARTYISFDAQEVRFNHHKKGLYRRGQQEALTFIENNAEVLESSGLTNSMIQVMVAVSENEGNLDAINTWDNAFLTFGMFQWTLGVQHDAGELPALLKKIQQADPEVFTRYYGEHGLGLVRTGGITGFCSLNGQTLRTPEQKEQLRTPEWAFYFWFSGQDPLVQRVEIEHALSRIGRFYHTQKVNGHQISELVTSEYGVGLLLDNHVNRPAYVQPCLRKALEQTELGDPLGWGTEEEGRLIEAYLVIRETHGRSPMTDARKRANVTKRYVENGTISAKRGSFDFRT